MSENKQWNADAGDGAQSAAEWANSTDFFRTHAKNRADSPDASTGATPSAAQQAQAYHQAQQQASQRASYRGYQQPNAAQRPWNEPYDTASGYGTTPVPYQYGGPVGQPQKSKVAAGVLGILLGSLGVHKFYLGYTAQGLILLGATLITLGFAAPVTSIIGLIEGIVYLTKSDQDFYHTYEYRRKPWF